MSLEEKDLVEFGSCRYSFLTRTLSHDGSPVSLQPRTIGVLEYLLANRDRVVSRQELIKYVWNDVSVEDNAVDYQIRVLRRALSSLPADQSYIKNFHRRGWQFVAEAREVQVSNTQPRAQQQGDERLFNRVQPGAQPELAQSFDAATAASAPRRRFLVPLLTGLSVVASVYAILALAEPDNASVIHSIQLTSDGWLKWGPIQTDGKHLFFQELRNNDVVIVSVPVTGGQPMPLPLPLGAVLQDISPDGKSLIFLQEQPTGTNAAYKYSFTKHSVELLGPNIDSVAWNVHGAISFVTHDSLFLRDETPSGHITQLGFSGPARQLKWSPDGRVLRYSTFGAEDGTGSIWEFGPPPQRLQGLQGKHNVAANGVWSRNGRYFFYQCGDTSGGNVWVEYSPFFSLGKKSVQLTRDSGFWKSPASGSDDDILYAIHREPRQALVNFDKQTNEWHDMWDGSSALELDYSPNNEWVTFVDYRDHSLSKARPDGSQRTQLAPPAPEIHQPHWSRDGQRIAFMGRNSKGAYRIFIVSADGGAVQEVQPNGEDQGVPTWSPDDKYILFGERLGHHPRSEMRLRLLDLKTRQIQPLDETRGLWSPRWSPDGRSMLAVTSDSKTIRVSPADVSRWKSIVSMAFVDNVMWSYDSRYVYFNGYTQPPFKLYRVAVSDGALETLADLKQFRIAGENWWGVSPDGTLLGTEDRPADEVYRLKCKLP